MTVETEAMMVYVFDSAEGQPHHGMKAWYSVRVTRCA